MQTFKTIALLCALAAFLSAGARSTGPKSLVFAEKTFDFGIRAPGQPAVLEHKFALSNRGTKAVKIISVGRACRTVADCPVKVLEPGKSSWIRVISTLPSEYANESSFSRQIKVETSDPYLQDVELQIRAHFILPVRRDPTEIAFGAIVPGQAITRETVLTNLSTSSLRGLSLAYNKDLYSVDQISTRLPSPEYASIHGLPDNSLAQSIILRCKTKPSAPKGPFVDVLLVRTNRADQPEIRIPVSGRVTSVVQADPEEVFLGVVAADGVARKTIRLASTDPGFAAQKVSCDIPGLQGRIEKEAGVYLVNLTYKPNGFCGPIEGALVIATGLPSSPELRIGVTGFAKRPAKR